MKEYCWTQQGSKTQPPAHQLDAHPTKPLRLARHYIKFDSTVSVASDKLFKKFNVQTDKRADAPLMKSEQISMLKYGKYIDTPC